MAKQEMSKDEFTALYNRCPMAFAGVFGLYVATVVVMNQAIEQAKNLDGFVELARKKALVITHLETAKLWLHSYADDLPEEYRREFHALLDRLEIHP